VLCNFFILIGWSQTPGWLNVQMNQLFSSTVELRFNKPLYIHGITNDIFQPNNCVVYIQCMEKNLDITKPQYHEPISPVPWHLVKSRFHRTSFGPIYYTVQGCSLSLWVNSWRITSAVAASWSNTLLWCFLLCCTRLFQPFIWVKSWSVTIQMIAVESYRPEVLFVVLEKIV